jgi:hypothetical protein
MSACSTYYLGGLCLRKCSEGCRLGLAEEPEAYGDYTCRDWDNLQIASVPVCEWGDEIPCSFMSALGLSCRALNTGCHKLAGNLPDDPGFCLR